MKKGTTRHIMGQWDPMIDYTQGDVVFDLGGYFVRNGQKSKGRPQPSPSSHWWRLIGLMPQMPTRPPFGTKIVKVTPHDEAPAPVIVAPTSQGSLREVLFRPRS